MSWICPAAESTQCAVCGVKKHRLYPLELPFYGPGPGPVFYFPSGGHVAEVNAEESEAVSPGAFPRGVLGDPRMRLNFPSSTPRLLGRGKTRKGASEGLTTMFSSLGLFKKTRCPDIQNCKRASCLFSHSQNTPAEPMALNIPIHAPKPKPEPQREQLKPTPSSSSLQTKAVPSKRAASHLQTTSRIAAIEPPRKISKVGSTRNPGAVPTSTQTPVSSQPLGCYATICGNAQDVTHS